MNKKPLWVLGVLVFLISLSLRAELSRKYDPVVVEGKYLPQVLGTAPTQLRLLAWKDRSFKVIPYQIDERYEEMFYWQWTRRRRVLVYALNLGEEVKPDFNPGFDADDELVFMSRDLGEKAPAGKLPPGAETCQEIEVGDPESQEKAYAYLCRFSQPPPKSYQQYVFIGRDNDLFIGQSYKIGYKTHQLFFDQLHLGRFGNFGPDLVDRFKVNYDCYGFYGTVVYSLNNNDINGFLRGIKLGPIRIIKEVVGVSEPWAHVQNRLLHYIYYYPYHIEWKMETRAPINWGKMNDLTYSLSLDLNPETAEKSQFLSEKNPVPVVVDGVLDEEELNLDYGPQRWEALGTRYGTIYTHLALPFKAKGLYPDLYYVDMEQKQDEPEDYFGMFGKFGFTVRHLQKTGRRPVIFRLMYFFSPTTYQKGSEENFLKIYTEPLIVRSDSHLKTAMPKSLPIPKIPEKKSPSPLWLQK